MPKSAEAPTQDAVKGLFEAMLAGDETAPKVSAFVTSGKRWELVQKDVEDEVVILHRFKGITTHYGDAYLVDIDRKGEQSTILIGGQVLMTQLDELAEHLPIVAVIRKPGRAYVFTDATEEEMVAYQAEYLT